MADSTRFMLHCIVLPPKLPQAREEDLALHQTNLTNFWRDCVGQFCGTLADEPPILDDIQRFAETTANAHSIGSLDAQAVTIALKEIDVGDAFAAFVEEQNCGLIFYRVSKENIRLEVFEVSATNAAVMSTEGPLQRTFPGFALDVQTNFLQNAQVLKELSGALADLATQPVEAFLPVTRKAGNKVTQIRDSASPAAITGTLASILLAYGHTTQVTATTKKFWDEVCWQNCLLPWRRPGMWTVLRVSTQRWLEQTHGKERGWRLYKNFQILILTNLCCRVVDSGSSFHDELFHLRAKLSRRLDKLNILSKLDSGIARRACDALEAANRVLNQGWTQAIRENIRRVPRNFQATSNDTRLLLKNSASEIEKRLAPSTTQQVNPYAGPSPSPYRQHALVENGQLKSVEFTKSGHDLLVALFDFETQVPVIDCKASLENCKAIDQMFSRYECASRALYDSNYDHASTRLLTLAELWMKLDQLTCALEPLVCKLTPDIPIDFMRHLRLPDLEQMSRAKAVEDYVEMRTGRDPKESRISPFTDGMVAFACTYYDDPVYGAGLRDTRFRIDRDARKVQEAKRTEWEQKEALCRKLEEEAISTWHERTENRYGRLVCEYDCRRCSLQQTIDNLCIDPIEEPLPKDENTAKWVIFELLCPIAIQTWREVTWRVVTDLGRERPQKEETVSSYLMKYQGLSNYHSRQIPRLSLATEKKSFHKAHYGKSQKIKSTMLDRILLSHGPEWFLFDFDAGKSAKAMHNATPILFRTYPGIKPDTGRYQVCSDFISNPIHTPNAVVGKRSECHSEMPLFEFDSFGLFRSGELLQLPNLLVEFTSPSLDFSQDATNLLVTQAALQLGCSSLNKDVLRQSHGWYHDYSFCLKMLDLVSQHVRKFSSNWKEISHMRLLLVLALRMESLCQKDAIKQRCRATRGSIREASHSWTVQLRQDIMESDTVKAILELRSVQLSAALLCRATYTCSDSPTEWGSYFESGFIVANERPAVLADASKKLRHDIIHDWALACKLETSARNVAETHTRILSNAVSVIWQDGDTVARWTPLGGTNSRWVWGQSVPSFGKQKMQLHVNVLTGELLVDGQRPDRLPAVYLEDTQYRELFDRRSYEVLPSPVQGMKFTAKSSDGGLHFGWDENGIRIGRERKEAVDLLLVRTSFGAEHSSISDLPSPIIEKHVHWLRIIGNDRGNIHICPVGRAFGPQESQDWILIFPQRHAKQGQSMLIEPSSSIAVGLSNMIGPFELHKNMVATFEENQTRVSLPRFGLMFQLLGDGRLQCDDLNGLLDDSQEPTTFVGLHGSLIFSDIGDGSKFLVVPHGKVALRARAQHVQVTISYGTTNSITFSKYKVNKCLGRLDCNAETKDMLFKAYLHAVCSGHMPDPLTNRRGTEEALDVLNELLRQLYKPLEPDVDDLLRAISSLTPRRSFYPKGLQIMQSTDWNSTLTSASQANEFSELIACIINRSNELAAFYDAKSCSAVREEDIGNTLLQSRSSFRSSKFHPRRPGSCLTRSRQSQSYNGRDALQSNDKTQRAYELAMLIKAWSPDMMSTKDLGSALSLSKDIGGFHKVLPAIATSSLFSEAVIPRLGSAIETCRRASRSADQIRLLFLFPFLAFIPENPMTILRATLAIAFDPKCQDIEPPQWQEYATFRKWERPDSDRVYGQLASSDNNPNPPKLTQYHHESYRDFRDRESGSEHQHTSALRKQVTEVTAGVIRQWPRATPVKPGIIAPRIAWTAAEAHILYDWQRLWRCWNLSRYFEDVSNLLHDTKDRVAIAFPQINLPVDFRPINQSFHLVPDDLLRSALDEAVLANGFETPAVGLPQTALLTTPLIETARNQLPKQDAFMTELKVVMEDERFSRDAVRTTFTSKLKSSLECLCSQTNKVGGHGQMAEDVSTAFLKTRIAELEHTKDSQLTALGALAKAHFRFKYLRLGGLWPRMSPADMFRIMGSQTDHKPTDVLKSHLAQLALSTIEWQRFKRILVYYQQNDKVRLRDEMTSDAHGWDIELYTNWLILEIEMDVCIRSEQATMALSMAKPECGQNTIYQLQMGKGKSSMIIPMLAATLPRKDQLLRVVVTKPLLHQMGAILKHRLCRILGRPLLHLPFSRATTHKDLAVLKSFKALHQGICDNSGVVLALPEHMQSLQLSGVQCLLDRRTDAGIILTKTYKWLETFSRDVLDECDHILSPRTQLIYPSGTQSLVDGGAIRWQTIARILRCVLESASVYESRNPDGIEVEDHHTRYYQHLDSITNKDTTETRQTFPFIHFHSESAACSFVNHIVDMLTHPESPVLPLSRLSREQQAMLRACLKDGPLTEPMMDIIEERFQDSHDVNVFLILRGLLGRGILSLALQKRWNVQYGLDLQRCDIAVPYQARGRPSAASEYGHPDVAITLTYLAYYYQGLSRDQFLLAVGNLRHEHDPSLEWSSWARDGQNLAHNLNSWSAVNLDDDRLMTSLWNSLSHSLAAINFYLDRLVFPRAAREFERKLVSSSWDLILKAPRITTGFSGTNDNSLLMPNSITPGDLPMQGHTNAEVLWHLLQPRNRGYILAADQSRKALSVEGLLDLVSKMQLDVLLDAGALVLEMGNAQVASEWLHRRTDAKAAVYFNEGGLLTVVHRNQREELLTKSRYASNLSGCLLYLDEEHCRGTDTRLPACAKAALTIGPRQPKDQTVQAAMRLRQLAYAQSIVFLAPPAVDRSIRDFSGLGRTDLVDSRHVIAWSIEQSCSYIDAHMSLCQSQRDSFRRRDGLLSDLYNANQENKPAMADAVPEKERRSLLELYGPGSSPQDLEAAHIIEGDGEAITNRACAEEEQERQVDQEVQEEQHREHPNTEEPCEHSLHPDVTAFVHKGVFRAETSGYQPCFRHMMKAKAFSNIAKSARTRLAKASRVFVTMDFCRTLQNMDRTGIDQNLRPGRWLAWSRLQPNYLMILSPWEAQRLIPGARTSNHAHIILYEGPRTRAMIEYHDKLSLYGIPRLPSDGDISKRLLQELFVYSGATFFPFDSGEDMRSYMRELNKLLDPKDIRRSSSDIGLAIAKVWEAWIGLRHHGTSGLLSPAGCLIRDRALDRTDRMFCV